MPTASRCASIPPLLPTTDRSLVSVRGDDKQTDPKTSTQFRRGTFATDTVERDQLKSLCQTAPHSRVALYVRKSALRGAYGNIPCHVVQRPYATARGLMTLSVIEAPAFEAYN